ncbi:MAG: threonine/serine exporter family protein [Firmicutes bacterium]|nr:threonine/serine exporter family protein [Bacillota bacterium]
MPDTSSSYDVPLSVVMRLAADAGVTMLSSGGEISRVEETIDHLARAYGVRRVDAYATPTGLLVSGESGDGSTYTIVRRVPSTRNDLARVVAINDLSRRAFQGRLGIEEAQRELNKIRTAPPSYTPGMTALAASVASAMLAMLFGGAPLDMMGAAIGGLVIQSVINEIGARGWGAFARSWVGGFLAAAIASVLHRILPAMSVDYAVVGAIMILVPGVAITNSLRDVMGGQLVSGVARAAEALTVAVGVAAGVFLGLGLGGF